jgi:hypothetical protein
MQHPFITPSHLTRTHADRLRRDVNSIHGTVNLPNSTTVRAEVAAMLDGAVREPPAPATWRVGVIPRVRNWIPGWIGWLRAMPLP